MLIGTTSAPFDGEVKPMMSTYQKIILIPRPDYASRHSKFRAAPVTRFYGGEAWGPFPPESGLPPG